MQLSFFLLLSACALVIVSANNHKQKSKPKPTAKQVNGPTVVKCLVKLTKCSKSKGDNGQHGCLVAVKQCLKPHQRFLQQRTAGLIQRAVRTYPQCLGVHHHKMKRCITGYLRKVMNTEKLMKFDACVKNSVLCYSTWLGEDETKKPQDESKKPKACKISLEKCLNNIKKAPKSQMAPHSKSEQIFPCYMQPKGDGKFKKANHHEFVRCLGQKKMLIAGAKNYYCARTAHKGAETCDVACKKSYLTCFCTGEDVARLIQMPIYAACLPQRPYNPYNQYNRNPYAHVNRNHENGRAGNQRGGYNQQGGRYNQGGYQQGNQGGYPQGNQGSQGGSTQGGNQPQTGGTQQGY